MDDWDSEAIIGNDSVNGLFFYHNDLKKKMLKVLNTRILVGYYVTFH